MQDPIVVDFEGLAKGRPVMAGVLVDGEFRQVAFTDVAPAIALAARARRLECTGFAVFCAALVERARREQRAIAGFSEHERKWIADGLGGAWPGDVAFVNAKSRAKRWRSRLDPQASARVHADRMRMRQQGERCVTRGNRLIDFAELAGFAIPANYGAGEIASTIRRLLAQSANRRRARALTPEVWAAWRVALKHNRYDCVWARRFVRMGGSRPRAAVSRPIERGDSVRRA